MIPFESKLAGIKNLEERNNAYKALSIDDRRREIGYDMLMNYVNSRIKPQRASHCYWPDDVRFALSVELNSATFQKKVIERENEILCSVCARGALMVSRIKLGNEI